jgi:vacuolar-type H+-ATPase subunit H
MKEVVDAILKAEQDAKLKVDEARKKARQITSDAENGARENAASVVDDAKQEAARTIQQAKDAAIREKRDRIEKGRQEVESLRVDKGERIETAVEEAFRSVIGTDAG